MITKEEYQNALKIIARYIIQENYISKTFSFTDDEKRELKEVVECFLRQKTNKERTLSGEWLNKNNHLFSKRLKNFFRAAITDPNFPVYIGDLDTSYFFKFRNVGKKSWQEFTEIRGY